MSEHASAAPHHFDELDPHGAHQGGHHGHVIVGPFTLRTVLALLLFFTIATVGLAQLEVYIQHAMNFTFPWWVNVAVAMSIAVVKTLLVMAYFMQLRYDNPMNSIVMAFTVFGLFLFLFFSGLDLFSRGSVTDWKAQSLVEGGTGWGIKNAGGKPIVDAARERGIQKWGPEKFEEMKAMFSHGHGEHHEETPEHNTASRSRPRYGLHGERSSPEATAPATEGAAKK